jgi:hypothetical protein
MDALNSFLRLNKERIPGEVKSSQALPDELLNVIFHLLRDLKSACRFSLVSTQFYKISSIFKPQFKLENTIFLSAVTRIVKFIEKTHLDFPKASSYWANPDLNFAYSFTWKYCVDFNMSYTEHIRVEAVCVNQNDEIIFKYSPKTDRLVNFDVNEDLVDSEKHAKFLITQKVKFVNYIFTTACSRSKLKLHYNPVLLPQFLDIAKDAIERASIL